LTYKRRDVETPGYRKSNVDAVADPGQHVKELVIHEKEGRFGAGPDEIAEYVDEESGLESG